MNPSEGLAPAALENLTFLTPQNGDEKASITADSQLSFLEMFSNAWLSVGGGFAERRLLSFTRRIEMRSF